MTDRTTPPADQPTPEPDPESEPTVTIVGRSTPKFEQSLADLRRWQAETERAQRRNQDRWQADQDAKRNR